MIGLFLNAWVALWPSWIRYIWALLNQIPQLLGSLVWIENALITLTAIISLWLFGKYGAKKILKVILTVVVFLVSIGSTLWVSYRFSNTVADEARSRSEEAFKLASTEFNKTKNEQAPAGQDARTSAMMNVDQAIAKITSQIYLVVYYKFPEIQLRSISVHLLHPAGPGKLDDVLNLVQEGREKKDSAALPLYDSFIGDTMVQGRQQICHDVRTGTCGHYKKPINIFPDYASLFCFPLGEPSLTPKATSSAGICFDSKIPYAFEGETTQLIGAVTQQLNFLSLLLTDYRDLRSQLVSQNGATPSWLP